MCGENIGFFIIKQIKKIPLCSVEQLGHGEKTLYFSLHFFHALQLPACFTTEQKHKWKFGRRNLVGGEILWEHNSPKLQTSMLGFL